MEALLDSIRIAVSDGASDDERRRGLAACRAVADALENGVVVDMAPPPALELKHSPPVDSPTLAGPADTTALAALSSIPNAFADPLVSNPFRGMTADQILDLAIAKLRGAVGDDAAPSQAPAGQPFRLTLVPVPRVARSP